MADLKELIETVARALADQPDAVSVRESDRRGTTVYEVLGDMPWWAASVLAFGMAFIRRPAARG